MDVITIRWVSLAVVFGLGALAVWAFADATKPEEPATDGAQERALMLEVRRPGKAPELVRIEDGTVLGRSRECHIVFDDSTVSKEHARLRLEGRSAFVEDLHSTNGTLVNGRAIDGPTRLRRGDRIGLGANVIVFAGEI
ncbi:MAG: FHA domain-containing protein [Candidatus Eremiobacteraeota bacterium]|nr:FHA domain-containing protein [Candidatus Eremiobacteraeota bacterium]